MPAHCGIYRTPNHWDGLVRFLEDGRSDLDTNPVERAIRPIALSRMHALFADSDEGAKSWAAIASLIGTCELYCVNRQAYLTELRWSRNFGQVLRLGSPFEEGPDDGQEEAIRGGVQGKSCFGGVAW